MDKNIIQFWFNEHTNWFSKDNDSFITTEFKETLNLAINHKLNNWKKTFEGHLAYIILLDQFTRNIYRNDNPYRNDHLAYYAAKELLGKININEIKEEYLVFILLPLRHSNNIIDNELILDLIKNKNSNLIKRFRFHTIKKLVQLKTKTLSSNFIDLSKFNDILENSFQFSNLNTNLSLPIVDTIRNFINKRKNGDKNSIIVSLSGGVDSMVILYIIYQLKIVDLYAIHLDYGNRDTSSLEAEFIMLFCNYLKIPLRYRFVNEAQRNTSDRSDYEELTRKIRFNEYKQLMNELQDTNIIGVILGHHNGDLSENIIFNIMKGRSLIDLTVLKEESIQDNIHILRPLLSHLKKDIFEYAEYCNVPYFKNSTPSWSNRGKFREIILPALQDTFGSGVLTNVNKIGKESDELFIILNEQINEYLTHYKDNTLPIVNKPFTFWRYTFIELCKRLKISTISYRSLTIFYNNLGKQINLTMNKNLVIKITNTHLIIKLT